MIAAIPPSTSAVQVIFCVVVSTIATCDAPPATICWPAEISDVQVNGNEADQSLLSDRVLMTSPLRSGFTVSIHL